MCLSVRSSFSSGAAPQRPSARGDAVVAAASSAARLGAALLRCGVRVRLVLVRVRVAAFLERVCSHRHRLRSAPATSAPLAFLRALRASPEPRAVGRGVFGTPAALKVLRSVRVSLHPQPRTPMGACVRFAAFSRLVTAGRCRCCSRRHQFSSSHRRAGPAADHLAAGDAPLLSAESQRGRVCLEMARRKRHVPRLEPVCGKPRTPRDKAPTHLLQPGERGGAGLTPAAPLGWALSPWPGATEELEFGEDLQAHGTRLNVLRLHSLFQ